MYAYFATSSSIDTAFMYVCLHRRPLIMVGRFYQYFELLRRPRAATSNFEVDGFISISSTSKIWNAVSNVIL